MWVIYYADCIVEARGGYCTFAIITNFSHSSKNIFWKLFNIYSFIYVTISWEFIEEWRQNRLQNSSTKCCCWKQEIYSSLIFVYLLSIGKYYPYVSYSEIAKGFIVDKLRGEISHPAEYREECNISGFITRTLLWQDSSCVYMGVKNKFKSKDHWLGNWLFLVRSHHKEETSETNTKRDTTRMNQNFRIN